MAQNIGKRIDPAEALRKRKWLVILPTLGCVLATGVVSFLLPPVWRVDCLIQSPQIALESPQGTLQVSSFIDLRTTAAQITRGAYRLPLAKDLGLDPAAVGPGGRKLKILKIAPPPARAAGRIVQGETPQDKAAELARLLHEEAKLI